MEKLKRELEEKLAEVTRMKSNLQSSETVSATSLTRLCVCGLAGLFRPGFPPYTDPSAVAALSSPDVGPLEKLTDGCAGREGAGDAICEREGGGAVVSASGCAAAAVVPPAGARQEQQGAGRAAGQTAGEGQSTAGWAPGLVPQAEQHDDSSADFKTTCITCFK